MCCKKAYRMNKLGDVFHKLVSCSALLRYVPEVVKSNF